MKTAVLLAACMGGLAFGVTAVAVFERWSLISDSRPAERDKRERPKAPTIAPEEKRRVYPYSIVAGGARTVEEAKRAMNDPAVRAHYATVDLSKLKRVTLTADISGYVSYRSGDQIYWTAKKLVLKAGETVFTDGEHVVRGRCLNRYSPKPMFPVQTNPPSEKVLNTPVEVPLVALEFPPAPLPFGPPPLIPFAALTPTVPNVPGSPAGSGGRRFFPGTRPDRPPRRVSRLCFRLVQRRRAAIRGRLCQRWRRWKWSHPSRTCAGR